MAREAGFEFNGFCEVIVRHSNGSWIGLKEELMAFAALVRADERMSFYGQDKPVECADGCPPNQICDYCQVVAPAKAMILAEREACAKVCEELPLVEGAKQMQRATLKDVAAAIRARGNT
jgi:hypothetical protein